MKIDKRSLIRWKIYLDRARMYIGYINFFMIIVVFINAIKDNKYGQILVEHSFVAIPLLFVLFLGFSLILGFFDSRMGIRSEEMRNISAQNPVTMEMLLNLKEINKKLAELEEKVSDKDE
ncbi:MAG: hypothetical protein ACOC2E_05865 [Bacteroidota bacterium]